MAFNSQERTMAGERFVFVTRTNSKPLTDDEIDDYFTSIAIKNLEKPKTVSSFKIPREREKIFLADLKYGMEFCTNKYAVKKEDIELEAKRIFPALNIETIGRKKDGQSRVT